MVDAVEVGGFVVVEVDRTERVSVDDPGADTGLENLSRLAAGSCAAESVVVEAFC